MGVRGEAKNDDGPYLKWYSDSLDKNEDAGKLEFRDYTIYIKIDDKALIGIYKSLEDDDSGSRLSFEGT